jgi:hypothetical protein
MNHTDAVKLGACEKYLMGDLAAAVRDEFEEHYFDCSECARDLRAASLFLAASRQALEHAPAQPGPQEPTTGPRRWFARLRPAFAPAFAALLLVIGYQNFVTVPHLRSLANQAASSNLLAPVLLHDGLRRGGEPTHITVAPGQSFAVYLELDREREFPSYEVRLEGKPGETRDLLTLTAADIQKFPLLKMPSNLTRGTPYTIRVWGQPERGNSAEVGNFSFLIEIPANIEQH